MAPPLLASPEAESLPPASLSTPSSRQLCPAHPTEPLLQFCTTRVIAICTVCTATAEHDGHHVQTLSSLTYATVRDLRNLKGETAERVLTLNQIKADAVPRAQQLHDYVDDEVSGIHEILAEKQAQLHRDVTHRAQRMKAMLDDEIAACEAELSCITDGEHVMDAVAMSEGVVSAPVGQLIHGNLSFTDFAAQVNPRLHDPSDMRHLLGLQLPITSLHEMCELLHWTESSIQDCPTVFPTSYSAISAAVHGTTSVQP